MNITAAAKRAGFDVQNGEIYPPYIDPSASITEEMQKFADLIMYLTEIAVRVKLKEEANGEGK